MLRIRKDCLIVFKWAIIFKIAMFILQIMANMFIPDHQGSMDNVSMQVHRHPDHDIITETLLGGFDNWDSEYYIYIAGHGYTFLQSMAFFPLYPMLMWFVGRVALFPLNIVLADRSLFLLSGTLVNLCVFPFATVALYLLTLFVTDNQQFSILTILLFCVNPASVFMSAVYAESLFAFCVFAGLCLLTQHRSWSASVLFSLASATRSNGIILVGFMGFYYFNHLYMSLYVSKSNWLGKLFTSVFMCTLQSIMVVLPFVLFQLYSFWQFCHTPASSVKHMYEWCHWTLPLSYSYIQDHYWNVGLFRYFELKQIPNFLLALPVVSLSFCTLWSYTCDREKKLNVFKKEHRCDMIAYMVHLLFLVGFGVFIMHIQVLTRFLFSSSPIIYWFAATVISDSISLPRSSPPSSYRLPSLLRTLTAQLFHRGQSTGFSSHLIAKLIVTYFVVYVIIGFLLHTNFYPWT